MHAEQLEAREPDAVDTYKPETPFLIDPAYQLAQEQGFGTRSAVGEAVSDALESNFTVETPFVTEYELVGEETESYEMALHREVMEELYDDEFNEALEDLVNDVREAYEARFAGELTQNQADGERQMAHYLAPLEEAIHGGIDHLIAELMPIDNEALTEAQLDQFLEAFEYQTELGHPAFENFFGKIFKKIKKVAKNVIKKGAGIVKKGLKVLKKFSPVHVILGKLKKLVKPLLKRVLKFALNRIPAQFRPLAKRLARRFLKGALGEIEEGEIDVEYFSLEDEIEQAEILAADGEAAAISPEVIAAEFDALLTGYAIEGEEFDYEPALASYVNEEQLEGEGAADDLDKARDRFIQEIMEVETEEEAIAKVEQFIPAILAALKIGIKVIGRKRVVNFLAKLVAKLIGRFVGRQAALPLSRALVDAGLGLVSLESPEEAAYAAGEVVANTVQETVDRFVTEAPPEAFENEDLMEVYVNEAFERAVARNFPPKLVRKNLRHCSSDCGAWVMRPAGRRRKLYKKFTRRLETTITAQMAKRVRTFGGQTLYSFLKEQLGLPIDSRSIKARVHLFEGIRGTSLSDISALENRIEGLGSRERAAWSKIHPLTREAASVLIPKHVGLARSTPRRFLARRTRIGFRQRFYYLEISGARTVRAPVKPPEKIGSRKSAPSAPARASEVNVTIDFGSREIRIYDFLSEAASTEIAQAIRAGKSHAAIVKAVNTSLASALRAALSGSPGDHLKIKREAPAEEAFVAGIGPILQFVGRVVSAKLREFVIRKLLQELKATASAFSREFVKAADSAEDGVTLIFTISRIGEVFAVLTGNALKRVQALAKLRSSGISAAMKISVRAGFHKQ